jgi:N utilization substance protein B
VEVESALADGLATEEFTDELKSYIERVVRKVFSDLEAIDGLIAPLLASNWDLGRIAKVDRAILRMATAEFYAIEEMPPKVTINEAVVIATEFGDKSSSKFINAILGKVLPQTPKAKWDNTKFKDFLTPAVSTPREEPEEEIIQAGSPEHDALLQSNGWTLRTD